MVDPRIHPSCLDLIMGNHQIATPRPAGRSRVPTTAQYPGLNLEDVEQSSGEILRRLLLEDREMVNHSLEALINEAAGAITPLEVMPTTTGTHQGQGQQSEAAPRGPQSRHSATHILVNRTLARGQTPEHDPTRDSQSGVKDEDYDDLYDA
jgi:hypothetical protein